MARKKKTIRNILTIVGILVVVTIVIAVLGAREERIFIHTDEELTAEARQGAAVQSAIWKGNNVTVSTVHFGELFNVFPHKFIGGGSDETGFINNRYEVAEKLTIKNTIGGNAIGDNNWMKATLELPAGELIATCNIKSDVPLGAINHFDWCPGNRVGYRDINADPINGFTYKTSWILTEPQTFEYLVQTRTSRDVTTTTTAVLEFIPSTPGEEPTITGIIEQQEVVEIVEEEEEVIIEEIEQIIVTPPPEEVVTITPEEEEIVEEEVEERKLNITMILILIIIIATILVLFITIAATGKKKKRRKKRK